MWRRGDDAGDPSGRTWQKALDLQLASPALASYKQHTVTLLPLQFLRLASLASAPSCSRVLLLDLLAERFEVLWKHSDNYCM